MTETSINYKMLTTININFGPKTITGHTESNPLHSSKVTKNAKKKKKIVFLVCGYSM